MRELKHHFVTPNELTKESKLWAAVAVNMKYRGQNMLNYTKYAVNKFQSVGNSKVKWSEFFNRKYKEKGEREDIDTS